MAVRDFNGDGIADLAIANAFGNTVSVLLGNGDGSFHAPTSYGTGNLPASVVVSHFNGDGIADVAIVNRFDNTLGVLLNSITQAAAATCRTLRLWARAHTRSAPAIPAALSTRPPAERPVCKPHL